jgi:hypothetical protein
MNGIAALPGTPYMGILSGDAVAGNEAGFEAGLQLRSMKNPKIGALIDVFSERTLLCG